MSPVEVNKAIRGVSKENIKKVKAIHNVADPEEKLKRLKCFEDVKIMVGKGEYTRNIVTFIVSTGEWDGLSPQAIASIVRDYQDAFFSRDLVRVDGGVLDDEDPLAEVKSLQRLYKIHEERIMRESDLEKNLGKLFSTTHKEFDTATNIVRTIMDLKAKHGITGESEDQKSVYHGRVDIQDVVNNPESRNKVLGFIEAAVSHPDLFDSLDDKEEKEDKQKKKKLKRKRVHK